MQNIQKYYLINKFFKIKEDKETADNFLLKSDNANWALKSFFSRLLSVEASKADASRHYGFYIDGDIAKLPGGKFNHLFNIWFHFICYQCL